MDSLNLLEENWQNQKTSIPRARRSTKDMSFQSLQTNDNFEEVMKIQSHYNILKVLHRHGIPDEHQIAEIIGDDGYCDDLTPEDEILQDSLKIELNSIKHPQTIRKVKTSLSSKNMEPLKSDLGKSGVKIRVNNELKKAVKVVPVKVE